MQLLINGTQYPAFMLPSGLAINIFDQTVYVLPNNRFKYENIVYENVKEVKYNILHTLFNDKTGYIFYNSDLIFVRFKVNVKIDELNLYNKDSFLKSYHLYNIDIYGEDKLLVVQLVTGEFKVLKDSKFLATKDSNRIVWFSEELNIHKYETVKLQEFVS